MCSPSVDVLEYHLADKGSTRNQEISKDKVREKLKNISDLAKDYQCLYPPTSKPATKGQPLLSLKGYKPTIIHDKVNSAILQSLEVLPSLAQIISQNKLRLFCLSFRAYSL